MMQITISSFLPYKILEMLQSTFQKIQNIKSPRKGKTSMASKQANVNSSVGAAEKFLALLTDEIN